jgi:uncharacterized membrane protein
MTDGGQVQRLFQVGIVAAFATLAFVGTLVVRIPIPATGGYFNLGDTFVMAAALLYGPLAGGIVGAVGPAAADAVGFPQFILATAVVKGLEGVLVGLLASSPGGAAGRGRAVVALAVGVFVLVSGYFVFEAVVYPALARSVPFFGVTDPAAALAEVLPNLAQGTISAVVAFGVWNLFRGRSV